MVDKFVDFCLILRLLRVIQRQYLHKDVGWVCKLTSRVTKLLKVVGALVGQTLVDNVPIRHQQQSIEVGKRLGAWLVNGANDCLALLAS